MIKYQIHKSCKSVFINGVIHNNTKCPVCNELITNIDKQVKVKDENKSNLAKFKRTEKTLNKLKKRAEKEKKILEREKRKSEREERKKIREEKKKMKENKSSLEVISKKMLLSDNWYVDYWVFENLPENLKVKPDYSGKYIIIQNGPTIDDYKIGHFIKVKEKFNETINDYEVEYYDEETRRNTVPLKSVRQYIKGQDKLKRIYQIERYIKNKST